MPNWRILSMKLQWTETAKSDLLAIRRYISGDKPTAAKRWVNRLKNRARNVIHAPSAGRMVPEFSRNDLREVIEGNYRIVYLICKDSLTILTIFESHRRFPSENLPKL